MKLTTPVKAFGRELSELTFRKPVGGDLRRCGFPFKFEAAASGAEVRIMDLQAIGALAATLANVPESTIDELSPADMQTLVGEILLFFGKPATADAPLSPDATS